MYRRVGLKSLDFAGAFGGGGIAREPSEGLFFLLQHATEELQIFFKRTEKQGFVSCSADHVPLRQHIIHLAAAAQIFGVYQHRVVGELAQPHEGLQHLKSLRGVVEQGEDFVADGGFHLIVALFLIGGHFRQKHLLRQFRQIGCDFLLRAPHKKWSHSLEEFLPRYRIAIPLDGQQKLLSERLETAQCVGVDEFHLGPQVGQRVLNGCAAQRDAVLPAQAAHHPRHLGIAVFDLLAFVQNDVVPLVFTQQIQVLTGGVVSGEHYVVAGQGPNVAQAFRPGVDAHEE